VPSDKATGWTTNESDTISNRGKRFMSSCCLDWLWGAPSLLYSGYWGSFPRVRQKGKKSTGPSVMSGAGIKNDGAKPVLPHTSY
jgi:hypothetical protein